MQSDRVATSLWDVIRGHGGPGVDGPQGRGYSFAR